MITEDTKRRSLRSEYQANLEAQLAKVDETISELRLEDADLNAKFHSAQIKLRELMEASNQTWEDLKPEVDQLFYELSTRLDEVAPQ